MPVAAVDVAGLRNETLNINGTDITLPSILFPRPTLKQTLSQPLAGRGRIDSWYDGEGLPDVADFYTFELRWDLAVYQAAEILILETLRATPPPHTFTYWKQMLTRYVARSGQQVFYLPRPDAFSKSYAGHTTQSIDGATVSVNGVAIALANTHYVTPVTAATVVTAGHVSISNTASAHPDAGFTVALFKFGTALAANDVVTVKSTPLFNVAIGSFETESWTGDKPGEENKRLLFVEVA